MTKYYIIIVLGALINFSCSNKEKVDRGTRMVFSEIIASGQAAVVETKSGKVSGYIEEGIYVYKGIPYAQAERFMPPVPPEPWEGVRSSRAYGPTCPQGKRTGWYSDEQAFAFDWDDGYPDENCLRVNVWTPGINDGKGRPVMVWLHGGGYSAGSGQELPSYNGLRLSKKGDVVIVSLNHRLNVLGFLDLSAFGEKYAKSGNAGLLDLVAALEWVRDNIARFGGDPSNVTIFGQSGGGGKVSALMVSPHACGLFHKAIVQSGSLLTTMDSKYSRRIGHVVMEELGLKPCDIDQLQTIPYDRLLNAGNKAVEKVRAEAVKNGFSSFIFGWGPTVDGDVLPCQPGDFNTVGYSKDIPMIIGSTLHEFTTSIFNPGIRNVSLEYARTELGKKYGDKTEDFITAYEKAYPDFKPQDLFDVDAIFRPGVLKHAALKHAQQGAPVYVYLFTWESPVMDGILRSTHCMELPFVFDNIYSCRKMTGGGEAAYKLADKISNAWIAFAKTGNPNVADLIQWEPYTVGVGATMIFNNTCEIKYNHDKDLMQIINLFRVREF